MHVKDLSEFLPHRDQMIWIDEVIAPGICLVHVDAQKHYFSDGVVRQSAYIEWMAQAFGYSSAFEKKQSDDSAKLSTAYLVGFSSAKFSEKMLADKEQIHIETKLMHEMDGLSLVDGRVLSLDKKIVYCEATLKLFSE